MAKKVLNYTIFFLAFIAAHIFVFSVYGMFASDLNHYIFGRKHINTESDKIWIMKTLGLWLSLYLFFLAALIMFLRVITGKSTPASNNDPVYINAMNRILTNTIQQSIIFGGLYATMLFNDSNSLSKIGGVKILSLASIFVVGRITFAGGYLLGTMIRIPTLRGFGFGVGFIVNLLMVSYHLGYNLFDFLNQNIQPLVQTVFS